MAREISGSSFRVGGRVQGVGFRWFGRRLGEEIGLTGWIRNRADGDVEGEAFGSARDLDLFFSRLRLGPPAGRVDHLERDEIVRAEVPTGFEIRH
jgi:acylphosphatase